MFPVMELICYICREIIESMDKQFFRLIALREAIEFIENLPDNVREKVLYNIRKVRGGVKDSKLFKKLGDSPIWEFRTEYMGIAYRLFAFWDKDGETLVVATHGFRKSNRKRLKVRLNTQRL